MNEVTNKNAKQISRLIMEGIDAWLEAGRLLVETLDNGSTLDDVAGECGISKDILCRFEQIGRNSLYPRLLASTSVGARALSCCPFSEQKYYCHNPVKVLVVRDDVTDFLLVPIDNLTTDQVKQVFSRGHIRNESEQKAYIETKLEKARMSKAVADEDGVGYTLKGGRIAFKKGCVMSKDDLISILGRMK